MKILWVAQLTKNNSYSKVSADYIELINNLTSWHLETYDISQDTPEQLLFNKVIEFQPDFLIVIHNDSNLRDIFQRLARIRDYWAGKLVAFVPIDVDKVDFNLVDFTGCQLCLTMNSQAADIIKAANKGLYRVHVLEHLVEDFYQVSLKRKITLKKEFYKQHATRFTVGIVNANNCRKRIDLGIRAFALFHQIVPDSLLVIKTTKPENGYAQVYSDWSQFTRDLPVIIIDRNITNSQLNELYNSFDLIINTTDGEGFGLTAFEAGLACVISILPYHSSYISLLPDNPELLARMTVKSTLLPVNYVRSCVDFQEFYNGNYYLNFILGEKCSCSDLDLEIKDKFSYRLNQISVDDNCNNYLISINPNIEVGKTIEEVIKQIEKEQPDKFLISISSDLDSLYYYLDNYNILANLLVTLRQYKYLATSKNTIELYLNNNCRVGVINPEEICQKMLYYYQNSQQLEKDSETFLNYIKNRFNSKSILKQLESVLLN